MERDDLDPATRMPSRPDPGAQPPAEDPMECTDAVTHVAPSAKAPTPAPPPPASAPKDEDEDEDEDEYTDVVTHWSPSARAVPWPGAGAPPPPAPDPAPPAGAADEEEESDAATHCSPAAGRAALQPEAPEPSRHGDTLPSALLDHLAECERRREQPDWAALAVQFGGPAVAAAKGSMELLRSLEQAGQMLAGDQPLPERIGSYLIRQRLGQGGMGVVCLADCTRLQRSVALKILRLPDPAAGERLITEARTLAKLRHPHVVTVHDCGLDGEQAWIAMEYLTGGHLGAKVKEARHLPAARKARAAWQRQVATWMLQAAQAVAHAHAQGILHRDLKPGNLLLDERGQCRVADFGLASSGTSAGPSGGTRRYLAPEDLVDGTMVGVRTAAGDQHAIGLTLHELLAGGPTYPQTDTGRLRSAILSGQRASLPAWVEPDLAAIVAKASATRPEERYPSVASLADDLERWLGGFPVRARTPSTTHRLRLWTGRHPALASYAAIGPLVLLAGITVLGVGFVRERRLKVERENALRQADRTLAETFDVLAGESDVWMPGGSGGLAKPEYAPLLESLLTHHLRTIRSGLGDMEPAEAMRRIGWLHQLAGAAEPARAAYAKALEQAPNDAFRVRVRLALSQLASDRGEMELAGKEADLALAACPPAPADDAGRLLLAQSRLQRQYFSMMAIQGSVAAREKLVSERAQMIADLAKWSAASPGNDALRHLSLRAQLTGKPVPNREESLLPPFTHDEITARRVALNALEALADAHPEVVGYRLSWLDGALDNSQPGLPPHETKTTLQRAWRMADALHTALPHDSRVAERTVRVALAHALVQENAIQRRAVLVSGLEALDWLQKQDPDANSGHLRRALIMLQIAEADWILLKWQVLAEEFAATEAAVRKTDGIPMPNEWMRANLNARLEAIRAALLARK